MKFEEHCPDGQKCGATTTGCLVGECQRFKPRSFDASPCVIVTDDSMQIIHRLAFENGRMRFLLGEAITSMSHAEVFIGSREKMHPEGRRQWSELIDRMREVLEPAQKCGTESARLEGGE